MRDSTLIFLVKGGNVLLGMKKRGFGVGKWNGYGGKLKYGESIEEAAIRELWEECCINAKKIKKMGELTFMFPLKPEFNQTVHVFVSSEFDGTPTETDEMKPEWFEARNLPFTEMWQDDPHWLPKVLSGERVRGSFIFGSDNEKLESARVERY
jgi:8-oxo-dGTP pyrophosphatase MutT (NUDIX family)